MVVRSVLVGGGEASGGDVASEVSEDCMAEGSEVSTSVMVIFLSVYDLRFEH